MKTEIKVRETIVSRRLLEDVKRFFINPCMETKAIGKQYKKEDGSVKWVSGKLERIFPLIPFDNILQSHLDKRITLGLYPFYDLPGDNETYVQWCCIDYDDHDSINTNEKLENETKEIKDLIEYYYGVPKNDIMREFSGSGFHIWIKLYPLTILKRAGEFCSDIKRTVKEQLKIVLDEVFPKQTNKNNIKYGNLVKIPLSINRKNGELCKVLDNFSFDKQGNGFKIPYWIPTQEKVWEVKKKIKEKEATVTRHYPKELNGDLEFFCNKIRPCLSSIIKGEQSTHNKQGDNGHWANMMVHAALFYVGANREVRISAFQNQSQYDAEVTEKQIIGLEKSFKEDFAKNLRCKTIRERGYCVECFKR